METIAKEVIAQNGCLFTGIQANTLSDRIRGEGEKQIKHVSAPKSNLPIRRNQGSRNLEQIRTCIKGG
jgi:hypothetical protein